MSIQLKQGVYFGQDLKSYENDLFKLSITNYDANYATVKHSHQNSYLSILTNGNYFEQNSDEAIFARVLERGFNTANKKSPASVGLYNVSSCIPTRLISRSWSHVSID